MSRSPAEEVAADLASDYTEAFDRLYELESEGVSFGGHERNCAYLNTGGARYANVSATAGLAFMDDGRAVATVDWDHDGDLDLWFANRTSPMVRFVRNDTPAGRSFLAVRLVGKTSNRDAIGSRVSVHLREPGTVASSQLIKTLHAGQGFLSQSSHWLHFGLGDGARVGRLEVRWPAALTG